MGETPATFLQRLTTDQLEQIVDVDRDVYNSGAQDAASLLDLVKERYPELLDFAVGLVGRMPGVDQLEDEHISFLSMISVLGIGAICRAAEQHDLPDLTL